MKILHFKSKDQIRYEEISKELEKHERIVAELEKELESLTLTLLSGSISIMKQKKEQ